MYIVRGKITRQNVGDAFYTIADPMTSEEIRLYWVTAYKVTGKCIHVAIDITQDQLELQNTQYWSDQASYEEYKNDPVLINGLFTLRNAYWAEHGITGVVISEETV